MTPITKTETIASILRECGRDMTIEQLMAESGYSQNSVLSCLAMLRAQKKICCTLVGHFKKSYWWNPEYVAPEIVRAPDAPPTDRDQRDGESGVQYAIRVSRTGNACGWLGL